MKAGDTVTVNEPGIRRYGEKGVIVGRVFGSSWYVVSFICGARDIYVEKQLTKGLSSTYPFETHIRNYDKVEVHTVTGIPAEDYVKINLPDKVRDTL